MYPSRLSVRNTPPARSWEPRNNYYEEKKISSQVAASFFVDRIIFKDPAQIRDDGADRRKKAEMRNAFDFFLSPLTGATSPLLSSGVKFTRGKIDISDIFLMPYNVILFSRYFANNLSSIYITGIFSYMFRFITFLKLNCCFIKL